jgi:hypothetical protein
MRRRRGRRRTHLLNDLEYRRILRKLKEIALSGEIVLEEAIGLP